MASLPHSGRRASDTGKSGEHESFLVHANMRCLKVAVAVSVLAALGFLFADVEPRPNGGTWYGYALGIAGAFLIVWLALLGVAACWFVTPMGSSTMTVWPSSRRRLAVTSTFSPLGSMVTVEPGHRSRFGINRVWPLPDRAPAMVMACRSVLTPTSRPFSSLPRNSAPAV